jgi:hypothetical protein
VVGDEVVVPATGAQSSGEADGMKVLVGTLYSGENEYEECVASIKRQSFRDFDHFVFKDLPEREAHHTLFKSFVEKAERYDVLIKVDADMVLCSDDLFDGIVRWLGQEPDVDVLGIGVQDFYTGRLINGLNAYRSTVRWDFDKETLFVDIPEVAEDRYHYDDRELAPAAVHCKNPSSLQAFHYGVHRGLKAIARIHGSGHWAGLRSTWENFRKTGDVRIGLAVLGAELVYGGKLRKPDADYTSPRMKELLAKYEPMGTRGIEREIRKLRTGNWGVLPGHLRRKVVRALRSGHAVRGESG